MSLCGTVQFSHQSNRRAAQTCFLSEHKIKLMILDNDGHPSVPIFKMLWNLVRKLKVKAREIMKERSRAAVL